MSCSLEIVCNVHIWPFPESTAEMQRLLDCALEPRAQSTSPEYIVNPENTHTGGDVMYDLYLSSWNNSSGTIKPWKQLYLRGISCERTSNKEILTIYTGVLCKCNIRGNHIECQLKTQTQNVYCCTLLHNTIGLQT
jgi:hypothetical protein